MSLLELGNMRDVPACAGHMRRFMYYFGFLPEAYASDCQAYTRGIGNFLRQQRGISIMKTMEDWLIYDFLTFKNLSELLSWYLRPQCYCAVTFPPKFWTQIFKFIRTIRASSVIVIESTFNTIFSYYKVLSFQLKFIKIPILLQ